MTDAQRSFLKALAVVSLLIALTVWIGLATGAVDTTTDHQLLKEIRDLLIEIRDQRP